MIEATLNKTKITSLNYSPSLVQTCQKKKKITAMHSHSVNQMLLQLVEKCILVKMSCLPNLMNTQTHYNTT